MLTGLCAELLTQGAKLKYLIAIGWKLRRVGEEQNLSQVHESLVETRIFF